MFLYLFRKDCIKQVTDNPSVADVIAVGLGGLMIIKFDGKSFLKMSVESGKITWTKVEEADILSCRDGRIHQ